MTSLDVARASGVSRTTVSYVLNDTPGQQIPEPTRRRVLEAAQRLQYVPSAHARALRSGRSDVVLVVIPDWPVGHTIATMTDQLSAILAPHQLTLIAHQQRQGERSLMDLCRAVSPAAVIGLDAFSERDERAIRALGIQVTCTVLDEDQRERGTVTVSQNTVTRLQVAHLVERGHQRLGFAYPADVRVSTFARRRLAGTRRACRELGLPAPLVATLGLDPASGAAAVAFWRANQVTGVCAYNDEVAFAVLAGARLAGVTVPAELAVIGVDDIPLAALASPPLTSISIDLDGAVRGVSSAILSALSGHTPADPARDRDSATLVRREST